MLFTEYFLTQQIQNVGMPESLSPMVFAFTGDGNVSQGAQEMFNLFPHEYIQASELATLGKLPSCHPTTHTNMSCFQLLTRTNALSPLFIFTHRERHSIRQAQKQQALWSCAEGERHGAEEGWLPAH